MRFRKVNGRKANLELWIIRSTRPATCWRSVGRGRAARASGSGSRPTSSACRRKVRGQGLGQREEDRIICVIHCAFN